MRRSPLLLAAIAVTGTLSLTACAGGGASDVAAQPGSTAAAAATSTINLYAYAVPKVAFDVLIPAFQQTTAGKGVQFQQSYGASGDQSRKVAAGAEADFVNFSVEPDVTRLVDASLVDSSWNSNEHKGIPFGSVVTIVTRKGNPKGIKDWDDLLKPGVEVVTPNPFSSGSAKWNLLAPYAAKSEGGTNKAAGLAYIKALVGQHVKIQPKSGREATEAFLQGSGDVLLSYENEALFIEKNGDPVQHVTPPQTFKIENPAAVLKGSKNLTAATAFDEFLYTPAAQKLVAEAGFRPVDATVAAEYASKFPAPTKLWTIADLGGWKSVDSTLFKKDVGDIAVIYDQATQ
ncbi:sulfate ABC transporter substrate-binding protein [Terrabacter sp. NPDC000476]|uniref:sulfate ABC transporter substrate-binding protein n=1 Tax=Terrabacter sp. NPDC000476 TaxID=3154258 RepID=UPI00333029FC